MWDPTRCQSETGELVGLDVVDVVLYARAQPKGFVMRLGEREDNGGWFTVVGAVLVLICGVRIEIVLYVDAG